MAKIEKKIVLDCEPLLAFKSIADMEFLKKINPESKINNEILIQNERMIRYKLKVPGVGEWISERILVPESLTMITHRLDPLSPFKFLVVLHHFKYENSKTMFLYKEEFEMDSEHESEEESVYHKISSNIEPNLNRIAEYFKEINMSAN